MSPGWPRVGLMTRRRGIVPAFALLANFLMLPLFRTFRSPARSLVSSQYPVCKYHPAGQSGGMLQSSIY